MNARLGLVLMLALAFTVVDTSQARAQFGSQAGFGFGGFGFDIGRLYRELGNNVPFYAAYPPVYYSAPIPRTYGYSPFAYPPGVATPDLPVAPYLGAKEIVNPFVPTSTPGEQPVEDKVTKRDSVSTPLVVTNPFVAPSPLGSSGQAVALKQ